MRLLTLALGVVALLASTVQAKDYDICVIGAGAGGTAAAVYGTKNGYSVLVMDVQRNLGGHCDTFYYQFPNGTNTFMEAGVAQLADTQLINQKAGPSGDGNQRWQVDTKKYINAFVKDPNYLQPLNIPADPFTTQAAVYAVDEGVPMAQGPLFGQSQLPDLSDPVNLAVFEDLITITNYTYPWLDNGNLTGPVPDELLVPFATFLQNRNWTAAPAMISLFTNILWYSVAMDKFENLPAVHALRFLAPTPQLLFADAGYWYGFNGGCQRFYDNVYTTFKSLPHNKVLVNTTITSVVRPKPSIFDWLFKPTITVNGYTLGVDTKGATTNTSFSHTCGSVIFGMPAVPASLSAIGFQLDPKESDVLGTVKTHGYFGAAVNATGRAVQQTVSNDGLYNIVHVNVEDPFGLSRGDPTWISLQGNFGNTAPSSISLLAGFSSQDMSQADARATMQAQLNAQLTQSIDGGATPAVFDTAKIVDFHAHRYQARPATTQLARTDGWYSALRSLQGYRHTFWAGATVNFPLHHVCINEAYNLIQTHFKPRCSGNIISYLICLAQKRIVDWDL